MKTILLNGLLLCTLQRLATPLQWGINCAVNCLVLSQALCTDVAIVAVGNSAPTIISGEAYLATPSPSNLLAPIGSYSHGCHPCWTLHWIPDLLWLKPKHIIVMHDLSPDSVGRFVLSHFGW